MSETKIEIVVSGDNAAQTLEQIAQQLPDEAFVVSNTTTMPSPGELIQSGIQASADLPGKLAAWSETVAASGGPAPATVLAICAMIFLVAYGLERLLAPVLSSRFSSAAESDAEDADHIGAAMRWAFAYGLRLIGFYILCYAGITFFASSVPETEKLAQVALSAVVTTRIWIAIIDFLTGARDANRRPTGLTDTEAAFTFGAAVVLMIVLGVAGFTREFVVTVVNAGSSGALFAVVMRLLEGAAITIFFVAVRKPVGRLITLATGTHEDGGFVMFLTKYWFVLYIILLAVQIAAEARGYLSGTLGAEAAALKKSFGIVILLPFLYAGVGVWRDRLLARAEDGHSSKVEGIFSLLEGALVIGAAILVLYSWNIDPFATDLTGAQRIIPGLVSAAIMIVVGISVWRTISAFLVVHKGTDADAAQEIPDDPGGAGGSRIETVFPILRGFLSAMIGFITVLLALSSLGVEIAPLLAGAGVLGLAIGFGAQKVVEDVISGILYLVEDAFRIGEYIETSEGKGAVESIMLRSVRLRHHRGPVFTIPYSAMGTIQNHSRDWVVTKLSFEVEQTVDLEKVRKLIKKIGQQLLEDPELEGQFLAPLKSQGAVDMVGSNYKIGVKFTSEPGKQFLIRRKALSSIQNAFAENGIRFASQRVIVDSPEAAAAKAALDAKPVSI